MDRSSTVSVEENDLMERYPVKCCCGRQLMSYVPKAKLTELGVLYMPASFVTYQRPQGVMQDCLRRWTESRYWCQKWDVNHSWLGPVLNLGPCHWMSQISQGCQGGGGGGAGTMDREDSIYMLVFFSCQSWGV